MTTSSPSPNISLAEQFQARRQREESTQKLFEAVSRNEVAEVKELLGKGADPNVPSRSASTTGWLPIFVAARNGFNEILKLLIQHKANVDGITPGYGTALHGAIDKRNQEGVEALLEAGANPNALNAGKYTPLQNAAQFGDMNPGILETLLIAGADVNAKTPIGTALDRALDMGQMQTARVLLGAGADADLVKGSSQYRLQNLLTSGY
jgi:uncharacterized protein